MINRFYPLEKNPLNYWSARKIWQSHLNLLLNRGDNSGKGGLHLRTRQVGLKTGTVCYDIAFWIYYITVETKGERYPQPRDEAIFVIFMVAVMKVISRLRCFLSFAPCILYSAWKSYNWGNELAHAHSNNMVLFFNPWIK